VACINAVFDSWNNDRAVVYRKHHDVRGLAGTAVNVQMMFPSEVSGILFTQDPNDLASGRMIVEASYGLGEAVVSGDVSPDRFSVSRDDPADFSAAPGHKARVVAALGGSSPRDPDAPSLSGEQLAELCGLGLKIEEFFGHPVDVEWGWAEGRFALLQARAIRGLEVARDVEPARQEEIERLRAMTDGRRRVWVTHNLAETLPAPTPLSWDIVREFMTGDGGFGQMYRQLGYRPSAAARRDGFLELIGGRVYADPERLAGMFWDGMPLRYELDGLVADKSLLDRGPTRFDPDRADGRFLVRLPGTLWAMWRSSKLLRRARRDAARRFRDEVLPPYLKYVEEKRAQDLGSLSDEQVLDELHQRRAEVLTRFGPESLRPGFVGSLAFDGLQQLLVQLMGPDEGTAMAAALTRALEGDTTFEQDALLYRVAHGEATMEEFLKRFGHRATNEMELAEPRWREYPTYIEQLVGRLRSLPGRGPEEIHRENLARRGEAEEQLPDVLARCGGSALREPIEEHLHEARALLSYRESGKHYLMMGYELLRLAIQELAERWDLGRKVYFLKLEELRDFARRRGELEETIEARRVRWQAWQRLDMPEVIDSRELDGLGLARPVEAASELKGTPVASGVATGTARVVLSPEQAGDLGPEAILICPSTDPGWTPLFLSIRGLVIERGGVLSHGAIVARDFGIPAVVCPDATRLLRDGAQVRVDGNHGTVSVLAEEETPVS
jgi:pyruvate,water dikinase